MIYEIINPSDAYTMRADSLDVAAVACVVLGDGAYGLQDEEGKTAVPIMLFGADDWFKKSFGNDFAGVLDGLDIAALANCLESVLYGTAIDRQMVEETLLSIPYYERELWIDNWNNRRSSFNSIAGRAKRWAKAIRTKMETEA